MCRDVRCREALARLWREASDFTQRQGYTKFFWNEVEEKFGRAKCNERTAYSVLGDVPRF